MVTIEELVDAVYFEYSHSLPREDQHGYETCKRALRRIATEQNRIARQEERERAELNFCIACDCYDCCEQRYNCESFNKFRKAIEEGGNQ